MKIDGVEREVIGLMSAIESIDSMVNHEVLSWSITDQCTEVYFHTYTHQQFFYIMLVDFISNMRGLIGGKRVCPDLLEEICNKPLLGSNEFTMQLNDAVVVFKNWINSEVPIEVWLPSINRKENLNIRREKIITIGGTMSKHNFNNLTGISEKISDIFKQNSIEMTKDEPFLIFDELYDRLHDDILEYHGNVLAEMLNNIRWGIHEYLLPVFRNSIQYDKDDPINYEYVVPVEINTAYGEFSYWGLMNKIRRGPLVNKFSPPEILKRRY